MSAVFAIFAFAWFVGWAVTLRRLRDVIDSATTNKEKVMATAIAFVIWPALLFGY